ncbi:aromatic acid decarboxylase [Achromatium sp. WMS1]|nr:aromatic acid decarboxylase [Achromatium sp. WMS1]
MNSQTRTITLAVTGASGSLYSLRLLECLLQTQYQVCLLISQAGRLVLRTELELTLPAQSKDVEDLFRQRFAAQPGQLRVFSQQQWTASIASGSNVPQAMIVCPCTTGTLSSIAGGLSSNLIERAAAVILKEQRKLILVVREMPLSILQLENMLRLARSGVIIMPASPGFYFKPQRVDDLIDFVVARILDHLDIPHKLTPKWGNSDHS